WVIGANMSEDLWNQNGTIRVQRLHHVGLVVASIRTVVEGFARSLSASWDGRVFVDSSQSASVAFLRGVNESDPLIELVEPRGSASPVLGFLKRGGGLHHLCYEVPTLERQLEWSRSVGHKVVGRPLPAVAFGGRRIAWVYTPERLLMEYLEAELPSVRPTGE